MILVDTDVLVSALKRDERTMDFLESLVADGEILGTTSLNVAEVLRGVPAGRDTLATAVSLLQGITEVPFGPQAARRYGRLMHTLDRAGTPLPTVDGMVAAVALEEGGRVVTRNRKHFERVAGLEVLSP